MAEINLEHYHAVKKKLLREKGLDIEDLGYNLTCCVARAEGKISLEARLEPFPGSPNPIDQQLFVRIKNDLEQYLQEINEDISINVEYSGITFGGDKE